MPIAGTCSKCGAELQSNALGGLCAKCLAQMALGKTLRIESPEAIHEPRLQSPGEQIGRYKLLEIIGEGGCGVVYLAEQQEPVRRQVALKLLKLGMDSREVIARFEAERQALALMDHPNIAKVLDAGTTEAGRPYFVMELVKGIPITRYCDENNLDTARRLRLFIRVCQAVQHAHQKGVIHRDIKPSNILVTEHDEVAEPKVIDFGIAKATTDQRLTDKTLFTAFEQFIGTPAYMSPEQAAMSGVDIDTRSDIYSLGVLLYELLTGRIPFELKRLIQGGLDEIRRIIREEEPMRPSTRVNLLEPADQEVVARQRQTDASRLGPLLRGDLDWIVLKALEKDRERRYETANGLGKDIQRYLESEPVVARPPGRLYRLQKLVRRNKLAFGAAAGVTISLILGLTSSSLLFVREREARQHAEKETHRAEAAALESSATLSASDFLQGCRLEAEGRASDALAYFVRSLSSSASNDVALTKVATVLMHESWVVPVRSLTPAFAGQYSADGTRILAVARQGIARLWDSETGQTVWELPQLGTNVNSAVFSPDGRRILATVDDGTVRLWNTETGKPEVAPSSTRPGALSAQFSPDGKYILTTFMNWIRLSTPEKADPASTQRFSPETVGYSLDGSMKLWEVASGKIVAESTKQGGLVASARFSPGGREIITVSPEGNTQFWDARTLQPAVAPFAVTNAESVEFSSNGNRILVVSRDGTARVWELQTGRPVAGPLKAAGRVTSARFDRQGKRVVTTTIDGEAQLWDAETSLPLTEPFKGQAWLNSAWFSPDGKRILTGSSGNMMMIWEILNGPSGTLILKHDADVNSARFSPDGTRVLTASADKTARIWDALSGESFSESLRHEGDVFSAEFSPDGRRIVTASKDKPAQVWDAESGRSLVLAATPRSSAPPTAPAAPAQPSGLRIISLASEPMPEAPVNHLVPLHMAQFSGDGKKLLTARSGSQPWEITAQVWNAQTGQALTDPLVHGTILTAAQFSPDGKRVVTASQDGTIQVWDAETGHSLTKPWKHGNGVLAAQFSPEGSKIMTASEDKTVQVWDSQTGTPLGTRINTGSMLTSAQFSPDGTRIVTSSDDGIVRIWDPRNGEPMTEPLPHGTNVLCAQFSPNGRWVATAASDGSVRVWDVRTGQLLMAPFRVDGFVHELRFSPEGSRVIAAASNGTARIWYLAPASIACPKWLLRLAEAICGKVVNQHGVLEPAHINRPEVLRQVQEELARSQSNDEWGHWGRWFLADPETRAVSPFAASRLGDESRKLGK